MRIDPNEFLNLLRKFETLPSELQSENIFDIAGFPHYENVCSNILIFFLNPNNEHGLGDLFFSSLVGLVNADTALPQSNFRINREVSTKAGGRLDIVIETDSQIVGIENKIFHHLNNDLVDYSESINMWARDSQKNQIKIILSLRKEAESSGFISITYEQYWLEIRKRLGSKVTTSSQKWLLYMVDFMSSIEKLYGVNMELNDNDIFFIENEESINRLIEARNGFKSKLWRKLRDLKDRIEKPTACNEQWINANSCLVHDFILHGQTLAFDLHISSQGWELQLFGRDESSRKYLDELLSVLPELAGKGEVKYIKHVVKEYELTNDPDAIRVDMLSWFDLLIKASKMDKYRSDITTGNQTQT